MVDSNDKKISIVIPALNEAGNIRPLAEEIAQTLRNYARIGDAFEIIFVDDGSTDMTADEIRAARQSIPQIRLIHHDTCQGMSAALRHGIKQARADWIITCDGDGQNDPADVPRLIELAWMDGMDAHVLVAGIRVDRNDTPAKKCASLFANGLRRLILRDGCPDTGCALKMFRREDFLELPFFDGLHRFLPALFKLYGHRVIFTPVNDRARQHGVSKSDFLGRGIKGFLDLLGVKWLQLRTPRQGQMREET